MRKVATVATVAVVPSRSQWAPYGAGKPCPFTFERWFQNEPHGVPRSGHVSSTSRRFFPKTASTGYQAYEGVPIVFQLFSLAESAQRLRRDDGQTIAECTVALAVLAVGVLLAITALALGDPSSGGAR